MRRGAIYIALLFVVVAGMLAYNRIPRSAGEGGGSEDRRLELVAENLALGPGTDGAVRIGLRPADASARVIATLTPPGPVSLCPLAAPAEPLPSLETCPDAESGVLTAVRKPDGPLGGIAVVALSDAEATMRLRIEYAEGGREISFHLPAVPAAPGGKDCGDNRCTPLFELLAKEDARPTSGPFAASARWHGGEAHMQLLQGSVRARSYTSTGIPYRIAATDLGPSPLRIRGDMTHAAEYALTFASAEPGSDLLRVVIEATWP